MLFNLNINLPVFFKNTVAIKGARQHDISFRRRKSLAKKFEKVKNLNFFSLLEVKLARFFNIKSRFNYNKITFKIRNRQGFGNLPFNLRFNVFHKNVLKIFEQHIKLKYFKPSAKKQASSKLISPYSKLWQASFFKSYFKSFRAGRPNIPKKIRNSVHKLEDLKRESIKQTTEFNSIGLISSNIFEHLQLILPHVPAKFLVFLLSNNFCSINGEIITNPFFVVKTPCIFSFNFFVLPFLITCFLTSRLTRGSLVFQGVFSKIKKYNLDGLFEVNFKTLEFYLLKSIDLSFSQKSFELFQFNLKSFVFQRFFSRQKKFGIGRLL